MGYIAGADRQAAAPTEPPAIRGAVENFVLPNCVMGWAIGGSAVGGRLAVRVLLDGLLIGEGATDTPRADIDGALRHVGFRIACGRSIDPEDMVSGRISVVAAGPAGDAAELRIAPALKSRMMADYVDRRRVHTFLKDLPDVLEYRGEFGTEIATFLPVVHWLHRTGALGDRTISTYAGMRPFYRFLSEAQVVERDDRREFVPYKHRPAYLQNPDCRYAVRAGMEWFPDYRGFRYPTVLSATKPVLIVHNKFTQEWNGPPVNYFSEATLDLLFSILKRHFAVVFIGSDVSALSRHGYSLDHQDQQPINEAAVLAEHPEVTDFNTLVRESGLPYNEAKLSVYSQCHFHISVQGGNTYLSSLFSGSAMCILHRRGVEVNHLYERGFYQHATSPPPLLYLCGDELEVASVAKSFLDFRLVAGRVFPSPGGVDLFERLGPHTIPDRRAPDARLRPQAPIAQTSTP